MNRNAIVDRRVRRDHYDFTTHHWSMTGFNARVRASLDLRGVSLSEQATTIALDRSRQTIHIVQRMKLCLSWKTKRDACIKRIERSACDLLHSR